MRSCERVASVRVLRVDLHVLNMRTRMPFRYGIASMTALPHLFVRVEAEVDGRAQTGLASEGLPPKWFTKDPVTTFRQDLRDMRAVIRHACGLALDAPVAPSAFAWWRDLYDTQMAWGASAGHPPLLAGLGASLVERAMLDAFCRATGHSFTAALHENTLGIRLGDLHYELAEMEPATFLPHEPLRRVIARHTVGLADPLTDGDVPEAERLHDGLPQSLEACIRAYGLTHFKLKLCGDLARDVARLRQIAVVLQSGAVEAYAFTLDGNEQYKSVGEFRNAWNALAGEPSLKAFMRHLLFVEQPLHRDVSLTEEAARDLLGWPDRPAIIIDESDGELSSLSRALDVGYAGTSHKNCKGVFRGIGSACLVRQRQAAHPEGAAGRYVISGEDLANVGPVALLQDLAVMASLGIEHVERNGHHYFRGLSMLPDDVQRQVLRHHGDLYRRHPDGYPTLDVHDGYLDVGSVVDAPFGTAFLLDSKQLTPLDEWDFDTLGVSE